MEAAIAVFVFLVAIAFSADRDSPAAASLPAPQKRAEVAGKTVENDVSLCGHNASRWIERDLTNPGVAKEKVNGRKKESPDVQ